MSETPIVDGDLAVEVELTVEEAEEAFADGYEQVLSELGRFNLAILGDTGVGKSSLVNAIFDDTRAQTGMGAPVTKGVNYHLNDDRTLGVWDFEGFEHGTKTAPLKTLSKQLRENQNANDERTIHVAWFCWDASSARVTDGHRVLIGALRDAGIPVIGVLTKFHRREKQGAKLQHKEFAEWIERENLGLADTKVYPTAAVADDDFGLIAHGLKELLDATIQLAPEATRDAVRKSQIIDKEAKRTLAWKWIMSGAASAAAVAATPIPVASAVVLAPIQLGVFGKVSAIYGTSIKATLGGGSTLQLLLQLTGRAAAQSLVKLIPGAGSVINATVASIWTAAAGEGWRRVCEQVDSGGKGAGSFQEFQAMFGPIVESLFKEWVRKGKAPEVP